MFKKWSILFLISCLLISSYAFTLRGNSGYKDYNKAVYNAMNIARTDPKYYAKIIDKQRSKFIYDSSGNPLKQIWYDDTFVPKSTQCSNIVPNLDGIAAWNEAYNYLNTFSDQLDQFRWSESLSQACYDLISDQGPKGGTGHETSGGSSTMARVDKYVTSMNIGEDLNFADMVYPEDTVLKFLIDDGVADRWHRKKIMGNTHTHVGVSWGCHSVNTEVWCIMYATDIKTKDPTLTAASAPQLKTCSAYSKGTSDNTFGNFVLSTMDPNYTPKVPLTTNTSDGSKPTVTIDTQRLDDGRIYRTYMIMQKVALDDKPITHTYIGLEQSAPSTNDVLKSYGLLY